MTVQKKWTTALVCGCAIVALTGSGFASEDGEGSDSFRRTTPSGQYVDPASFFRFHGYVSLGYAAVGEELGKVPGKTPQILVSGISPQTGNNESGFRNDAALFVGGEPFGGVGAVMEIHFVGNALNPVITEAKFSWDFTDEDNETAGARLVGGRYWWPFGIHNSEWFSAVNRFSLISPAAAEVVPAHYNEVGIMGEGEYDFGNGVGANFVVSIGNGTPSYELMDNVMGTAYDYNSNRSITSRLGLKATKSIPLEFGLSGAFGQLRKEGNGTLDFKDARRYSADFNAFGVDLTGEVRGFGIRSYYYVSTESLSDGVQQDLSRDGLTFEPAYTVRWKRETFESLSLYGRYSYANEDVVDGDSKTYTQYGAGVMTHVTSAFIARFNFMRNEETKGTPELDNDMVGFSVTAEF